MKVYQCQQYLYLPITCEVLVAMDPLTRKRKKGLHRSLCEKPSPRTQGRFRVFRFAVVRVRLQSLKVKKPPVKQAGISQNEGPH